MPSAKTKHVSSVGNVDFYPNFSSPITILNQYVENVTFAVQQIFDEEQVGMMGIKFDNARRNEESCVTGQTVEFGEKIEASAECVQGFAEVVLYLYTGDCYSFPRDNYRGCTLPNYEKFVAHTYKVPCTPRCKPKVPDCFEGPIVTHPDIDDQNEICLYDDMPIMIEKGTAGSDLVNFTVDNTWSSTGRPDDDIKSVSISYISKTGEAICETFDSSTDTFDSTGVLQAFCEDGLSTVVVNIHSNGITYKANELSGNMCELPENMGTCAYEILLPCDSTLMCETESPTEMPTISSSDVPTSMPSIGDIQRNIPTTPSPTVNSCPYSDAEFIDIDGITMYPEMPIKIIHQNTSHVGFIVENTFGGTISSVFTQYQSGSFGQSECLEEQNVDDQVSFDFVAQCIRNTKIAIVNVWMTDCSTTETFLDSSDTAHIPECCHAGEECKTVQYTFKLPCVPEPCPEDEISNRPLRSEILSRRLDMVADQLLDPTKALLVDEILDSAPTVLPRTNYDVNREALSNRRRAAASIPSIREQRARHPDPFNESEDHFCVTEDYPCGERGDKVHVCNYSSRDGYKTLCITEAESDAVRFFPKDYCGPCVGGFASV